VPVRDNCMACVARCPAPSTREPVRVPHDVRLAESCPHERHAGKPGAPFSLLASSAGKERQTRTKWLRINHATVEYQPPSRSKAEARRPLPPSGHRPEGLRHSLP